MEFYVRAHWVALLEALGLMTWGTGLCNQWTVQ